MDETGPSCLGNTHPWTGMDFRPQSTLVSGRFRPIRYTGKSAGEKQTETWLFPPNVSTREGARVM